MAKDIVTNKELYVAIMDIHKKIDDVVDKRIVPLELWQSNIVGKLSVLTIAIGVGFNLAIEWFRGRIKS